MAKKKATKKKAAPRKSAAKREVLVVGSKTKAALKGSGKTTFNVSSDALEALNDLMYQAVSKLKRDVLLTDVKQFVLTTSLLN